MTGHGDVAVERKAAAAGGIAFLRKPFPATTLMEAIKKAAE
jgi:FixJ family two-component response regulator